MFPIRFDQVGKGKKTLPDSHRNTKTAVGSTSLTKQSQTAASDINAMMSRFGQTPGRANRQASYGDYSAAQDLKASLDAVMVAEDSYTALPAAIRQVSQNNPVRLLEMLADPNQLHVLQAAGLDLYDANGELLPSLEDEANLSPGLPQSVKDAAPQPLPSNPPPPDGGSS